MYSDYEDLFFDRLVKLREKKGVSARSMSLSLGQNESYINQIESKKSFPSMQGFFYICDFLQITPEEFFSVSNKNPVLLCDVIDELKKLDNEQLFHIYSIIRAINKNGI